LVAGKGVKVRGKGTLGVNETYAEYQARSNPNNSRDTSDEADSDEQSLSICRLLMKSAERF
jgi:hypothetical protein